MIAAIEPLGHGFCLLWKPGLLWTHVISDAVIAIAYFSIPIALGVVLRSRASTPFRGVIWLFIAFIVLCGSTHVMDIINIWNPAYELAGAIKAATAVVSIATAAVLAPMLPRMIDIPDPYRDRSTSLPNRALLIDRIGQASARAKRSGTTFTLIFVDLDLAIPRDADGARDFDDVVLTGMAERLRSVVRAVDTVALASGTEFVILAETLDERGLPHVLRRVSDEATRPLRIASERIVMHAKIGLIISDGSIAPEMLLHDTPRRPVESGTFAR